MVEHVEVEDEEAAVLASAALTGDEVVSQVGDQAGVALTDALLGEERGERAAGVLELAAVLEERGPELDHVGRARERGEEARVLGVGAGGEGEIGLLDFDDVHFGRSLS